MDGRYIWGERNCLATGLVMINSKVGRNKRFTYDGPSRPFETDGQEGPSYTELRPELWPVSSPRQIRIARAFESMAMSSGDLQAVRDSLAAALEADGD